MENTTQQYKILYDTKEEKDLFIRIDSLTDFEVGLKSLNWDKYFNIRFVKETIIRKVELIQTINGQEVL